MRDFLQLISGSDSTRLGWALVHFVWQGVALALVLEASLALAGRKNASLRYLLCSFALAAMPVCLVDTYLAMGQESYAIVPQQISAGIAVDGATLTRDAPVSFAILPVVHTITAFTSRQMLSFDLNRWLPDIVACWLAGVVLLTGRKAGGFFVLWRLKRTGISAPSHAMRKLYRKACDKIGIPHWHVYLRISDLVQVPMTMGWVRPVILFPAALLCSLSTQEIELLLAHELAHIRRYDYLVNLVQMVVETLFFYHPVTWWISRRMRQERENCCDDLVAGRSTEVLAYAQVLFHLETLRVPYVESLAAAASGGSLRQRIQRLADERVRSSMMGFPLLLAFLTVLGIVTATSMVKAQAGFSDTTSSIQASSTDESRSSANAASGADSSQPTAQATAADASRPTILYQDNFDREGELDGSSPGVVNAGSATWTSSTGTQQYATGDKAAAMKTSAYAYSVAYLPVNGTSGVMLDGSKDFTVSVVVTPGATGRTGISLNTGTLPRYGNLFTNDFATLSTSSAFAGAYAFNGGNIGYNYAPGIKGPTRIAIGYKASTKTLTYLVGNTVVHTQTDVKADQIAAIRYVGIGNDGYGGGAATPAPSFCNFTFTQGSGDGTLSASARPAVSQENRQASL